ncbi:hypothetical protein ACOQFB_03215 [Anaeromyxobacter sp. Red801]|uniref:hypothetical protein n=1 Tax=Anaeromyxobacter sp. Red801 TaxID=3411632 RepID=UPI003BA30507
MSAETSPAPLRDLPIEPPASPPPAARLGAAESWRSHALAVATMAAALALFFAPALLTDQQFLFRDNGRMHWPVKRYVAEQLRQGHLPQWNPYAGLGIPLIGTAVDAVQHPFNLLLIALPFEIGFKAWVLLSFLLAATGAYAWARLLGRTWHAGIAAGLGFALSGALVGSTDNVQYLTTLSALPWMFAAAHAYFSRGGGPWRAAGLGLASGLCAAAGDPQAWGFAVALLVPYAATIAGDGTGWRRDLGRGAAAAGIALVGAAPFVLPVIAWMPESSRGSALDPGELQRWNLALPRLLELVLPHMYRDTPGTLGSPVYSAFGAGTVVTIPWVLSVYVGVSVFALAMLATARWRPARWLLLCAALFTWMALGHYGGFGQLLPHLPVLRGFRYWEKMAIWPSLLLPIAAAYGLDDVVGGRHRSARAPSLILGAGLAALAVSAAGRLSFSGVTAVLARWSLAPDQAGAPAAFATNLLDGLVESGAVCLVLGAAILAIQRGLVRRSPGPLLALVVVADLVAANVRGYLLADPVIVNQPSPFGAYLKGQPGLQRVFTPFDLPSDRWPELRAYESGWAWAGHILEPCFNLDHRVGNFLAYTGMVPWRLDRFNRRTTVATQMPHIGVFGVGFVSVPASPERARMAGLAPPFEVVAADPLLPAYLVRVPHRDRAYLASDLKSVDRRGAMEFVLEVDPARSDASVVEGPVPEGYLAPTGSAQVVEDAAERVVVETTADRRALLVLNDIHAAGWTARVDGQLAEILPANYLARGVWVDAGRHVVEFTYRTPLLTAGWAIFLIGGAAVVIGAAARKRRRPMRSAE